MVRPIDLLRQDRKDELWQMCCGFIDLSMDQFMAIQQRLLLEQIDLLNNSSLGRKVMRGAQPQSIDEFRRLVPLTTYADYCPDLQERREDALPARPARWIRTSGYSGTYETKWVPWSEEFSVECERVSSSCALFAMSRFRGDISQLTEHWKVLYTMGGLEYASGAFGDLLQQAFNFDFLPANPDGLPFTEKIKAGFAQAGDALIRVHLDKNPVPPATSIRKRLDRLDLHGIPFRRHACRARLMWSYVECCHPLCCRE